MEELPLDIEACVAQLLAEAADQGVALSPEQAALLVRHLSLVIERNRTLNLTRITEPADGVTRHVVDSLLLVPTVTRLLPKGGTLLDVGTGAGYPGIPLVAATGMRATLIDSVGKKVHAVEEFVDQLGIQGVECLPVRAEDLARQRPTRYDLVTARAVAGLNVLIEYATPLLRKGGYLVVSKANLSVDELADAAYAAKVCGLVEVSRETYELARETGHREILAYQKAGKPRIRLPRETGAAKHKPLTAKR